MSDAQRKIEAERALFRRLESEAAARRAAEWEVIRQEQDAANEAAYRESRARMRAWGRIWSRRHWLYRHGRIRRWRTTSPPIAAPLAS